LREGVLHEQITKADGPGTRWDLAAADASMAPPVTPRAGGGEIMSPDLIGELDAAAEAKRTTRKIIITGALPKAGYRVRQHALKGRPPRMRRNRRAA
jgi:hypothetical protein